MRDTKKTILITGAYGFVGSNISAYLKKNYTLWALDIEEKQTDNYTRFFTWNELEDIPQVDVIIHLAGKAHDTKNQTHAQTYFDINTGLTQKVYDCFQESNAKKFIFFSSVKAAADRVEGEVLTEDVIPSPKGPYGESKIAAENYIISRQSVVGSQKSEVNSNESEVPQKRDVASFIGSRQLGVNYKNQVVDSIESGNSSIKSIDNGQLPTNNSSLPTTNYPLTTTDYPLPTTDFPLKTTYILRPCMIHGPGNKGNLNLLYQVVRKGIPYPLGAFENKRSFTSIDNLCFVVNKLIEKDIPGGIYNVGDDEPISTNELISLMADIMHKPNRTWNWNKWFVEQCAKIGTFIHLPFNTERLKKLTENYVVSNRKLITALEIDKMPVKAEEGLRKTLSSL